jgi:hypothetical protein
VLSAVTTRWHFDSVAPREQRLHQHKGTCGFRRRALSSRCDPAGSRAETALAAQPFGAYLLRRPPHPPRSVQSPSRRRSAPFSLPLCSYPPPSRPARRTRMSGDSLPLWLRTAGQGG